MNKMKQESRPAIQAIQWLCVMALSLTGANAQIEELFHDLTQIGACNMEEVRKVAAELAAGTGQDLGYHSAKGKETKTFKGSFTPPALPENEKGQYLYGLSVFSDDGCDVSIDGIKVHSRFKKPQGLPRLNESLHEIPVLLQPGQEYEFEISYSNVIFYVRAQEPDIDGCTLFLCKVRAGIVTDFNRDGIIDDNDQGKVTDEEPWRWWVNDDSDKGGFDRGNNTHDIPAPSKRDANFKNDEVDGVRDLIDFFPVHLNIAEVLKRYPADENEYVLMHEDEGLKGFEYATCIINGSDDVRAPGSHVRKVSTAKLMAKQPLGLISKQGRKLSREYLEKCEGGNGVLLLEACKSSNKPLMLHVVKKDSDEPIVELSFPIICSNVESMFRQVNLRKELGGDGGRPSAPGDPEGYPDELTNGKYVAYIHGYNVSGESARGSQANLFKRFHQLGSRARFIGISWHGNPPNPGINLVMPPDYHMAVANGLKTGAILKDKLAFTQGADLTVMAHSLGNSVASSAIANHGLKAKQYYMINGAIALEAYDASQMSNSDNHPDMSRNMTEDSWKRYYDYDSGSQKRLLAANWYRLFKDKPNDHRNKLTWRNVFAKNELLSIAYNFYSPSDEVVENADETEEFGDWANLWAATNGGRHAWVQQEIAKGGQNKTTGAAFGDLNGGWEFNRSRKFGYLLKNSPKKASKILDSELITKPFHKKFLYADLHDAEKGSDVAGNLDNLYTLLGTGLPATSYAIAVNKIDKLGENNFDMMQELKSNEDGATWPIHKNAMKPEDWMHSDFKDVALQYVMPMYDKMINISAIRN